MASGFGRSPKEHKLKGTYAGRRQFYDEVKAGAVLALPRTLVACEPLRRLEWLENLSTSVAESVKIVHDLSRPKARLLQLLLGIWQGSHLTCQV